MLPEHAPCSGEDVLPGFVLELSLIWADEKC